MTICEGDKPSSCLTGPSLRRWTSTGVGQGSALYPVLTGLYIAPILHKIAPVQQVKRVIDDDGDEVFIRHPWSPKEIKANGNLTVQFFVDDGLIHVAGKVSKEAEEGDQLKYNCVLFRRVFEQLVGDLRKLGLVEKTDKL